MLHTILSFSLSLSQNPIQVDNDLVIMRDVEYAPVQLGQNIGRPLLMDVAFPTVTKGIRFQNPCVCGISFFSIHTSWRTC